MSDDLQKEINKVAGEVMGDAIDNLPKISGLVKPTAGKAIMDAIFAEDLNEAFDSVKNDVIFPSVKEFLCNTLMETVQRIFYGSSRAPRKSYTTSSMIRTYGRESSLPPSYAGSALARGRERDFTSQAGRIRSDNIVMATADKAQSVIDALKNVIYTKGYVTVAQLYDIVSYKDEDYIGQLDPTDNDYGWFDLRSARKKRVFNGWQVVLPEPELVKNLRR